MYQTSSAPSDAFRTDAWRLIRNLEEWGPRRTQTWHFRTHTWIFSAEYFRGFAVASWKAKRIAKESKFWIQIPTLSFLCTQILLWADLPYLYHTHTSKECILIQSCQITLSASRLPPSSHGWTPQDTFSLGSFQASKTDLGQLSRLILQVSRDKGPTPWSLLWQAE